MTHILETATYVDTVIFQLGMKDYELGLQFDPFADPFWKAGWLASSDLEWSRIRHCLTGSAPAANVMARQPNT